MGSNGMQMSMSSKLKNLGNFTPQKPLKIHFSLNPFQNLKILNNISKSYRMIGKIEIF